MTIYAVIITIAALLGWRLYLGQIRKTRSAATTAAWWEKECKKHLDAAIGNGYMAEAETKRADRMDSLAEKMEIRAFDAIAKWGDADKRSLPAAPSPTADQSITAKPWRGTFDPGNDGLGVLVADKPRTRKAASK